MAASLQIFRGAPVKEFELKIDKYLAKLRTKLVRGVFFDTKPIGQKALWARR